MKNLRPSKILDDSFNKNKGIGQKRKKEELLMQIFQISVSRYVKKTQYFCIHVVLPKMNLCFLYKTKLCF